MISYNQLWRISCSANIRVAAKSYSSLAGGLCRPPHILASQWHQRTAIEDVHGDHTYGSLWVQSQKLASHMRKMLGGSLKGERITYLTPNDSSNVIAEWAIWMNEAIAVPLCVSHPIIEKQYFVDDSQAKLIVGTESYGDEVVKLSKSRSTPHLVIPDASVGVVSDDDLTALKESREEEEEVAECTKALIIYTSGTTGRPKGVVLTHGNIEATTRDMVDYWQWVSSDVSLHVLPLHHIHGLVNALHVPLSVGAKCVMLPRFTAQEVWKRLTALDSNISVFTAVPTVYAKLLEFYDSTVESELTPDAVRLACNRIRLMISGSSALPHPLRDRWHALSGHVLLERYGMSEILMALSNPLNGSRVSGTVGLPFKSVRTIIAQDDPTASRGYVDVTNEKSDCNPGETMQGELYVKGPTVFSEYWNRPEATRDTFTSDGWFKTGDTMCRDADGYYKVLGRTSVDILKSGGYKISALDIESKLLLHDSIAECAVVGVPDPVYGQRVGALIVVKVGCSLSQQELVDWCSQRMPKYQVPRDIKVLGSMPKNAMGKVNKKALLKQYYPDSSK